MAKIFFNDKIIKHTKETIILNWFAEENGKTLFVRDKRSETYNGINHVYGEIDCHIDFKGDYYVDITESVVKNGETVLGLYIAEGTIFTIDSVGTAAPIFTIKERAVDAGLGMQPNTNRKQPDSVVGMGLFHIGAEVSIFKGDVRITDKLTRNGWERIKGPQDILLGIETTFDAFNNRKEEEQSTDLRAIEAAVKDKVIHASVLDTFRRREEHRQNGGEGAMFIFLKEDIRLLKEGKYLS